MEVRGHASILPSILEGVGQVRSGLYAAITSHVLTHHYHHRLLEAIAAAVVI